MKWDTLIKNMKKNKKTHLALLQTISTFIHKFEMNVQFVIQHNIFNPFLTIFQYDDPQSGNQYKMIRHFYYEFPEDEDEDDDEEEKENEEEDDEYEDIEDEEDEDEEGGKKKGEMTIEFNLPLSYFMKNQNLMTQLENIKLEEDQKKANRKSKKKTNTKKTSKEITLSNSRSVIPFSSSLADKYQTHRYLFPKKKSLQYVNFHQDLVFYYYTSKDQNEFSEEYNYDNHKLKAYQGDDLEEKTLDDDFLEFSDEVNRMEKVPIEVSPDYFDVEFDIMNLFEIEIKDRNIQKPLGDYLKELWLSNSNISVFDSFSNFLLNRFFIMDKYIKMIHHIEDEQIESFINMKISKEMDIDHEIIYYSGKLDLEFGINPRYSTPCLHDIGVFLKMIFQFLIILDRTSPQKEEEDEEEDIVRGISDEEDDEIFENEIRFYPILEAEETELQDTVENIHEVIQSFCLMMKENTQSETKLNQILESVENDMKDIYFGVKVKLFSFYMKEFFHKFYYDKIMKKSDYVEYHQELIEDFKKLKKYETLDEKELEQILLKWIELGNISSMSQTILGNLFQIS